MPSLSHKYRTGVRSLRCNSFSIFRAEKVRERGAIVDIPFSADDVYTTGGVLADFSRVQAFKKVYLCQIIHNPVGLVCSFVPEANNLATGGKIKFWGTDGNELADNSSAITSKTLTVFIRGI